MIERWFEVYRLLRRAAQLGEPDADVVKWVALGLLAGLQTFVLLAACIWIDLLGGPRVLDHPSKWVGAAVYFGLIAVNLLVLRDARVAEIERRFDAKPLAERRRGARVAAVLVSFALAFVVAAFVAIVRRGPVGT